MSEFGRELLVLILTPSLAVGALTYLAKKMINSFFGSKENRYKTTLKSVADKELETFKAEISKSTQRFNVKTSGVYEKQASVLIELYSQLSDLDYWMNTAINHGELNDDNYKKFSSAYFELRKYWRRNRLLLPKDIDLNIKVLMRDSFWAVNSYESSERSFMNGDFNRADKMRDKAQKIIDLIPQISEQLTEDFRKHIGVLD